MIALIQTGYGTLKENLQFIEKEMPSVEPGQVLVKVHSAGINPHDYKVILGEFRRMERRNFPSPVGSDFSGVIEQVGRNVRKFAIGDKVFGTSENCLAEYCSVDASALCKMPSNTNFTESAALPVVGMTTVQAFTRIGGISSGDKILIHAGSGGVGTFAIQYAKTKGAYVYTTTSTDNTGWVRDLGADRVIDYKTEDYLKVCTNLDIVFDTLGGNYTFDAFGVIKTGGKVVSLLPAEINRSIAKELKMPKLLQLLFSLKPSQINMLSRRKMAQYEFVFLRPTSVDLSEVRALVDDSSVLAVIEKTYEFEQSITAFEHLADGHVKGKLTIKM